MNGTIYCYTNLVNGKKYIGQTTNQENRKKAHKSNNCIIRRRTWKEVQI